MFYEIFLVLHVIFVTIAVGAVTVVDYLHIVGLRKKKLEKKMVSIYPRISFLINIVLAFIFLSGGILVFLNKEILSSDFFRLKLAMIFLVTLNGIYLQKKVAPVLDLCVKKGSKYCSTGVLYSSVICGVFSMVTWYSIFILSLTKNLGYSVKSFLVVYFLALIFGIAGGYFFEKNARKWN